MANHRSEDAGNTLSTGVVMFLERNPGLPFCEPCLAHELGVRRDQARKTMHELDAARFPKARRWCVRCLRVDMVVYAGRPDGQRPTPAEVVSMDPSFRQLQ